MSAVSKTGVTRRARSDSSSNGMASHVMQDIVIPATAPRSRYTHIIVLKSLNNTFETKFLVVPFKPEGLKLGRPVVNSGAQANGRQEVPPQVRSDNGHFDSRVLSRNHASLSCDSFNGKIYIRDLKSSNGTFVNGTRIGQSDVELKVGDVVDLGTDIDAKFEHRKISAIVEDISVIPLIQDAETSFNNSEKTGNENLSPEAGNSVAPNAQRAAFEAAMFGDVNNLYLEDSVLSTETEILSGIFINNSIGTSSNLIKVIKTLMTEITLEKHEFEKLKSVENFLINYTTNMEYINKLRVENNDMQLLNLQTSLRQKLNDKHEKLTKECTDQVRAAKQELQEKTSEVEAKELQHLRQVEKLARKVDDLQTLLEVEKYKNKEFTKVSTIEESATQKGEPKLDAKIKQEPDKPILRGKSALLLSALSVGALAVAFQYSSR
ncbi:LAMI_0H18932g1_1 [Lachancea mirantina]|uniref:LAMI_0H18932g1_1 n=1 Tax=Lachancea mirantina TaxID=1230905 RepID=A0A1G4KJR1_9SACH|nr:LAMI_0H18932g1_1 [Lachancea mirantina]